MKKRFKLNIGDVFTIPLNEIEVGFGQCVTAYNKESSGFGIAVFPLRQKKSELVNIDVDSVVSNTPILSGYTFDAKLYYNDWIIIGNSTKNIQDIKFPYTKLGLPPNDMYIVDPHGNILSMISEDIFNSLLYRTDYAPIRFENALKAHFGLQEWLHRSFDNLLYENTLKSIEIAQKISTKNM
jgi:hypothetical protein